LQEYSEVDMFEQLTTVFYGQFTREHGPIGQPFAV
jgi:hypothetical protein